MTHECPSCHQSLPTSEFYGGSGRCKSCKSDYYKQLRDSRTPRPTCPSCGAAMSRRSRGRRTVCGDCAPQRTAIERNTECVECGVVLEGRQRKYCAACAVRVAREAASHAHTLNRRPWLVHKKDSCESCGFRGRTFQLDVHHLDGDHSNNEPENLQTLCANCHRLETFGGGA